MAAIAIYLLKSSFGSPHSEWYIVLAPLVALVAAIFFLGLQVKKLGGGRFFEVCAAALASLTLTLFIMSGNISKARHQAGIVRCEELLKKLGPLYVDPEELEPELTKLTCPTSGIPYVYSQVGQGYILFCSGQSHPGAYTELPRDYPRYISSTKKVIREPLLKKSKLPNQN